MVDFFSVSYYETFWGPEYQGREPKRDDLYRFLQADTERAMLKFMADWPDLLGVSGTYGTTVDDYLDARDLAALAVALRSLLDADNCNEESLADLGFRVDRGRIRRNGQPLNVIGTDPLRFSFRGQKLAIYLDSSEADLATPIEEGDFIYVVEDRLAYHGDPLFADMSHRISGMSSRFVGGVWGVGGKPPRYGGKPPYCLVMSSPSFPAGKGCYESIVKYLLDELITLHLHDVRTMSRNGGREHRQAGSILSMLWYCMMMAFDGGRAGQCKVCGKPFISRGERGTKRQYCGPACNKWQQKHKDEHRGRLKYLDAKK